ncbi:hypothetical protein IAI18_21410 [Acetobacteraceae bacterium H6797]|nr:hypothetical protein [Acetobacteraceae bacterium H6797]
MRLPPERLLPALRESWSGLTSSRWRSDNPAHGQCDVTALVVQDLSGGELLKTPVPGGWHFYNLIDEQRHDLTASQFDTPPAYADLPASRAEALATAGFEQYARLKAAVLAALRRR